MGNYRCERRAKRDRLATLEAERRQVCDELERLRGLELRKQALDRELEELGRELRRPAPWVDQLRIGTPCKASWDKMKGDDRIRHCSYCNKSVYNIAEMELDELISVLGGRGDPVCVRLRRRPDRRTAVEGDCPARSRRDRSETLSSKTAGFITAGALTATAAAGVAVTALPTLGGIDRSSIPYAFFQSDVECSPVTGKHAARVVVCDGVGPIADAVPDAEVREAGPIPMSDAAAGSDRQRAEFDHAWRAVQLPKALAAAEIPPDVYYRFDVTVVLEGSTGQVTEVSVEVWEDSGGPSAAALENLIRERILGLRVPPFDALTAVHRIPFVIASEPVA